MRANRLQFRDLVASWDQGTGLLLELTKEASGERFRLTFVDATAPTQLHGPERWFIHAIASDGRGHPIGHLMLFLDHLEPGRFRGDPEHREVTIGLLVGTDSWDAQNPQTAWSKNPGAFCELQFSDPGNGDLEGEIQARLVDNAGRGTLVAETGYLYVNRP